MFGFQRQQETLFVFVHLPRCAGTFLLSSFSWLGKRRQIVISESPESKAAAKSFLLAEIEKRKVVPNQLELISGHDTYFGIHEVSPRTSFYFTFLRDPVERYLSNFRFLRDCAADPTSPVNQFAREAMTDNGTERPLEELIEQGRLANMMTHYLAATVEPDLQTARWHCKDEVKLVELAKLAIDRFQFIGFFDQLQQDAKTICDRLRVPLKPRQVNQTRSQFKEPISEQLRQDLAKLNRLDLEIYEYARRPVR